MNMKMNMKSLLSAGLVSAGVAALALCLVTTGAQAAPTSGLADTVDLKANRSGQVDKIAWYGRGDRYGYRRPYFGRGYGRGYNGRGFFGRGYNGRGFFGRGYNGRGYDRGYNGRGYDRGRRDGYRRW
jgi:hypothetical protein